MIIGRFALLVSCPVQFFILANIILKAFNLLVKIRPAWEQREPVAPAPRIGRTCVKFKDQTIAYDDFLFYSKLRSYT